MVKQYIYSDNLVDIETFTLFRLDREMGNIVGPNDKSKRGGGLALYVGSKYQGHARQINNCCKITKNLEQIWIVLEKPNVRKIAVCIYHRPPNSDLDVSLQELSNSIDIIQASIDVEIVIMGDINVNYRDRHRKSFERLKEFERVYNFVQLVHEYTRVTSKSRSTIDLIWTDMSNVCASGIIDIHLSDHLPIYVVKKKEREQKEFKYIIGRSYKNYVKEDFQWDILDHYDWEIFWNVERDPENSGKQSILDK